MSRLKADTQLTLLSRIPVMILSFLAVVLLTRLLGPEGNGVYTFTMAVLNLFFTVVGFQLDGSIPFFLAKYKDDQSKIFSAVGILALLSILLFVVILTLLVFVLPIVRNWVLPEGQPVLFFFLFLVISFSIRRISTLLLSSLRGLFRFKAFNLYMILHQLIPVVVYVFLLF